MRRILSFSRVTTILGLTPALNPPSRCACVQTATSNNGIPDPNSPINRLIWDVTKRINKYTVTWDYGYTPGPNPIVLLNVPQGTRIDSATAGKPADPTRTGFNFIGWYIGNDPLQDQTVSGDVTVIARWSGAEYTITWDEGEGTWADGTSHKQTPASYGDSILPHKPSTQLNPPSGKQFAGWYVNGQLLTDQNPGTVTGNVTAIAYYEDAPVSQYTMTWNPNEGTWSDGTGTNKTTSVNAGSAISAPGTPTRSGGWGFDGWYNTTLGRDYQNGDVANDNYTFTAKWKAKPVLRAAVTWQTDTDGGTNANHLVHGDPNNPYETNDWLYGSTPKIPLNIRFEPLYKDENGNEIGYGSQGDLNELTEPIGYCGGNPFYVDDIIWNGSYAQNSTMNQQYSMSLIFRTYNGSVDGGPTITQPSKGYGLAVSVETAHNNDSMLWRDEIPVTYTTRVRINENGTYNTYDTVYNYDGTVYSPTINVVVYSLQTLSDHGISSEPSPGTAITGPWIH